MMNQMMKECLGEDGKPDFKKLKGFMERRGKSAFSEDEIRMMRQFCGPGGRPDAEKMQQLMKKCGC